MSGEDQRNRTPGNGHAPLVPPFEVALGSNPFVDALAGEADPLDAWLGALDRLAATGEDARRSAPAACNDDVEQRRRRTRSSSRKHPTGSPLRRRARSPG